MTVQNGTAPYEFTCLACGGTWTPRPAKGRAAVTDHALEASAAQHLTECPARKESPMTAFLAVTRTVSCDLCDWQATIPNCTEAQAAGTWLNHYATHEEAP